MPHGIILNLLFLLGVGAVCTHLAARRSHGCPPTERLSAALLLYNLSALALLAFLYLAFIPLQAPLALRVLASLYPVLGLAWLFALGLFHAGALGLADDARLGRWARGLAMTLAVVFALALAAPGAEWLLRQSMRFLPALASLMAALLAWRGRGPEARLGMGYLLLFGLESLWLLGVPLLDPALKRQVWVGTGLAVLVNGWTAAWIAARPPRRAPASREEALQACGISPREAEIVELICQGKTNQEIAEALFIALKTVKEHNYRIFKKAGVRNRVELVRRMTGGDAP